MRQDAGTASADDPLRRAELTVLLGLAFQLVIGEFNRRVAAAGYPDLRPMHGMAFQALRDEGATSTELASRLGVTKQAAGQIVTELESRGYLRRQPHPDGGRRRLVVLTGKAVDHLGVAGGLLHALEAELAERVGDDTVLGLRTELARLIRGLAGPELPPLRPVW